MLVLPHLFLRIVFSSLCRGYIIHQFVLTTHTQRIFILDLSICWLKQRSKFSMLNYILVKPSVATMTRALQCCNYAGEMTRTTRTEHRERCCLSGITKLTRMTLS